MARRKVVEAPPEDDILARLRERVAVKLEATSAPGWTVELIRNHRRTNHLVPKGR